ncbi:hypothetical protein WJX74_002100 [Apatococcus lobatus]|uniref:Calcineurin-like phosphoesterase domain-containing protein n=1 Tax=Apatococcus lobatus TaxID=904363 RepID=A0AAW1R098_9CHLO
MQYASDIHLEYHAGKNWPEIQPKAPYLALAGDIGNPFHKSFSNYLTYCSKRFKHVYVVMGNHDCWSQELDVAKRRIRACCAEKGNCTFLDDEVAELEDVRIFGSTLWSPVTDRAAKGMNDYNMIYYNNKHLTADDTRQMHSDTVARIDRLLDASSKPLLVITHYAPLLQMNGRYGASPNISAFCADLWHLFRKPLVGWISGHTHASLQITENGIPCHSNCWGYDAREQSDYRQDAVMDVPELGMTGGFGRPLHPVFKGYAATRRGKPNPLDEKESWLSTRTGVATQP